MATASIGRKILMAITGAVAFAYILAHMLGNLQLYAGQDQLNTYAHNLKSLGPLLWVGRLVLLGFFLTHIWQGIRLKLENTSSRMGGYRKSATVKATLASRTMIYSGAIIFIFFLYHIGHFTAHVVDKSFATLVDSQGRPDVYTMVIKGFSNTFNSVFYIVVMILVGMHISHGIYSMFQTMGWNSPRFEKRLTAIAWVFTIIIVVGFCAAPLGVMTGAVKLPAGTAALPGGGM